MFSILLNCYLIMRILLLIRVADHEYETLIKVRHGLTAVRLQTYILPGFSASVDLLIRGCSEQIPANWNKWINISHFSL